MATNIFPQTSSLQRNFWTTNTFLWSFFPKPAFTLSTSHVIEIFWAKAGKAKKNVVRCAVLEAEKLFLDGIDWEGRFSDANLSKVEQLESGIPFILIEKHSEL